MSSFRLSKMPHRLNALMVYYDTFPPLPSLPSLALCKTTARDPPSGTPKPRPYTSCTHPARLTSPHPYMPAHYSTMDWIHSFMPIHVIIAAHSRRPHSLLNARVLIHSLALFDFLPSNHSGLTHQLLVPHSPSSLTADVITASISLASRTQQQHASHCRRAAPHCRGKGSSSYTGRREYGSYATGSDVCGVRCAACVARGGMYGVRRSGACTEGAGRVRRSRGYAGWWE
ncbi:hypothetical protein FB45DRAFT_963234 [Roridomyces roridus]|uniref:Uncharacterized protein n=1 Tax=Roridomyces roridus TaxID=1738132 RepID=A0AAD7AXU9_9AGAR|nr:hypothetical protein FB45DRAFT_963234 [Roridomyces roridus]